VHGKNRVGDEAQAGQWTAAHSNAKATEPIEPMGSVAPRSVPGRFVLTGVYRVAGSTRSGWSRQPACGALKARTPVHYAKAGGHGL